MALILRHGGKRPEVHSAAYVADNATLIGDVIVGEQSSIWFGTVLRGDTMPIRVGRRTSIQDNSVAHTTDGWAPTEVGDDCTVGHGVVLHGCKVGDRVLVGMGSILLDGAEIGSDTILGAGSLVTTCVKIPSGVLALGRPAKPVRDLRPDELAQILDSAKTYVTHTAEYLSMR